MAGTRVWRRLGAAILDLLIYMVAASLLAVALHHLLDGRVRASTLLPLTACESLPRAPEDLARAAGFPPGPAPVGAAVCTRRFLGLESGRWALVVQGGDAAGPAATRVVPLGPSGRPQGRVLNLDGLLALGFILVLAVWEAALRETPGKAVFALMVEAAGGGRPPWLRCLARKLIIYSPLLVTAGLALLPPAVRAGLGWAPAGLMGGLALASVTLLVLGRPDPAFDRWTGLRVVAAARS